MLNSKDFIVKDMYGEGLAALGKYTQTKYINFNQKVQGIINATQHGNISILNNYNHFAHDDKFQFSAHYGPIT